MKIIRTTQPYPKMIVAPGYATTVSVHLRGVVGDGPCHFDSALPLLDHDGFALSGTRLPLCVFPKRRWRQNAGLGAALQHLLQGIQKPVLHALQKSNIQVGLRRVIEDWNREITLGQGRRPVHGRGQRLWRARSEYGAALLYRQGGSDLRLGDRAHPDQPFAQPSAPSHALRFQGSRNWMAVMAPCDSNTSPSGVRLGWAAGREVRTADWFSRRNRPS